MRVATPEAGFEVPAVLDLAGVERRIAHYARGETIFTQGEACDDVMYIQAGSVKLSVLSRSRHEAVVAMLGPGDFFGEGCLAGQLRRMGTAAALSPSAVVLVGRAAMRRLLHKQRAMSDRFIAHMLRRNIRIEEDLIHQLVNSSGKRPAR
jgi:CRP/FNR family cyclic AMP-dependent transcriptional regulator